MELETAGTGLGHTIPPIIIKSVYTGSGSVELITEEQLTEDRAVLPKKKYKIGNFGLPRWVVIELRNGNNWVRYGFGRSKGLEVRLSLQFWRNGSWVDDLAGEPHLLIDGKTAGSPLTTEELSDDAKISYEGHPRHKRSYFKEKKKWRIARVEVGTFEPLSTVGNNSETVAVGFFDH